MCFGAEEVEHDAHVVLQRRLNMESVQWCRGG